MNDNWLPEDIHSAVEALNSGKLILYPTDTIWGIGCDAGNDEAVKAVYSLKKRDTAQPLIVLVSSIDMLLDYAESIHPRVQTLLNYHERPLTVIYPDVKELAPSLNKESNAVAIRVVQDNYCRALIDEFGIPIVSTSANVENDPFPRCFGEISSEVISGVDYVCKYRQYEKATDTSPSVIARYDSKGNLDFIRT